MDKHYMLLKIKKKMETLTEDAAKILSELENIRAAETTYANQLTKIQHYLSCYDGLIKEIQDENVNDDESTVQDRLPKDTHDIDAVKS